MARFFKKSYVVDFATNASGARDESLEFLISIYPHVLHPIEIQKNIKSGLTKVYVTKWPMIGPKLENNGVKMTTVNLKLKTLIRQAFSRFMKGLGIETVILKMQTEVIATMRESSLAAGGGNIVNGDKLV